jgi:hypothetical protein
MNFLCICHYDTWKFAALSAKDLQQVTSICLPHDKALQDSGHLKFVGSLGEPSQSKTILANTHSIKVEDGPYANTDEPFGAFFMIEANNIDEAVKIASLHPGAHLGQHFGGGIEVRPVDCFMQS